MTAFAKNERLYRRIWTKYKSSKLFWEILEDNKPNKRENRGKKTVNAIPQVGHSLVTFCWKRNEIRPSELFAFKVSLISMTSISEFMFVCFQLDISRENKKHI